MTRHAEDSPVAIKSTIGNGSALFNMSKVVPRGTWFNMTTFALFCDGVDENKAAGDAAGCTRRKNGGLGTTSRQRDAGRRARDERASMLGSILTRCTLFNHRGIGYEGIRHGSWEHQDCGTPSSRWEVADRQLRVAPWTRCLLVFAVAHHPHLALLNVKCRVTILARQRPRHRAHADTFT
jgi:hypothetical protein